MPRYFFHVQGSVTSIDEEGTELPDLNAAREEAVSICSETLQSTARSRSWSGKQWSVWVTDQPESAERPMLAVHVSLVEKPAAESKYNPLSDWDGHAESTFDLLRAGREITLKPYSVFARRTRSWYLTKNGADRADR